MDQTTTYGRKADDNATISRVSKPRLAFTDQQNYSKALDAYQKVSELAQDLRKKIIPFSKHNIFIDQSTSIYLFSDGYRDRFGSEDRGKFLTKRFSQLLPDMHQLSLQKQKNILEKTLEEWKGDFHQTIGDGNQIGTFL